MSQVPMVQCTMVGRREDAEEIVEALQESGVVHIAPIALPEDEEHTQGAAPPVDSTDTRAVNERLERRLRALNHVAPAPARLQIKELTYDDVSDELDALMARQEKHESRADALEGQIDVLAPWGEFNPEDIAKLQEAGVQVDFIELSEDEFHSIPRGTAYAGSTRSGGIIRAIFFDAPEGTPGARVEVPRASLEALRAEREGELRKVRECHREMGRFHHFAPLIATRIHSLKDRLAVLDALDAAVSTGPLFALEGFLPRDQVVDLEQAIEPFAAVLRVRDAVVEDERVPVKLKNIPLLSGFESIVESFSGIRYGEKDFTWAVGILFIMFGSLCLLDAGYGLMLFIAGLVLRVQGNKSFGNVFAITGVISVVIGLLVGQFFGLVVGQHVMLDQAPPLTLAQKPYDAFIFSLVVGMVALTFSYSTAIWQRGFKTHATGALLLVLAAMAAVYANMAAEYLHTILGNWQTPSAAQLANAKTWGNNVAMGLGGLSVLAWLAFPEPVFGEKARAGNIIWTLYSGTTGFVQDVLSHMRLFGIALSGSIMALVVNDIGSQFPLPVTALFAVFGHFFVFLLALLSLYIHTNRLIFLEWGSKCIDGGTNFYRPLRRSSAS
jgi:V/A-type H+-transporting ATPase subunit I